MPDGLYVIGNDAFGWCSQLENISLPASLLHIGERAFSGCYSLDSITIDSANDFYCTIGKGIYNKGENVLVSYPSAKGEVIIPECVEQIAPWCFFLCEQVSSIRLPETLQNIGDYAFYNHKLQCISLDGMLPPTIGVGSFKSDKLGTTIYVTYYSYIDYEADGWTDVGNVIEK